MKLPVIPVIILLLASVPPLAAAPDPPPSGDVLQWVKTNPQTRQKSSNPQPLRPEWIGTLKVALRHDPDKIHDDERDDPMRLNKIWRDEKGRVVIARVDKDSCYTSPAVFIPQLPTLKELDGVTKLSQLLHWFGPQHGWTDGWGSPDEMHWTEGWTFFTTAEKGRLRWLSIFAHVSAPMKSRDHAKVDILIVREGFLRPADPASAREKAAFPAANDLSDAEEREREAERAKLPKPLRDLMAAKQKRGDHDLRAYIDFVNKVRSDPRPELFNQLAARIDEGTCEIKGTTEDILSDAQPIKGSKPWEKAKKRIALRHAVAALDHVPDRPSLQEWTALILSTMGGGRIDTVGVDAKGGSRSYGEGTADSEDLKVAKSATRREFESKFPYLRPEPANGGKEK